LELMVHRNLIKGSGDILCLKMGEMGGSFVTQDCGVGRASKLLQAPNSPNQPQDRVARP